MLQNSRPLDRDAVATMLRVVEGERVRLADRPISRAVSPPVFAGVDCPLPTSLKVKCRGVGTVAARAVVVGCRVLQGSAYTRLAPGETDHRLPWSHYLAHPGRVYAIGKYAEDDVATGFLADPAPKATIDLGAVSERLVTSVQLAEELDHVTPLRARRTRMRWVANIDPTVTVPSGEFTIADDAIRTLWLRVPAEAERGVLGFCENLALHDWALTTLLALVERSELGWAGPETLPRLQPAIDHLLHLWMPGAHVASVMLPLWDSLEQRPGFTKQWLVKVDQIRDQLAAQTLAAMRGKT